MGAFKRVVKNLNDVGFTTKLDKVPKDRYQQMIARVFSRLDKYFTTTNFYGYNNYEAIVDTLLVDHTYVFELSSTLPQNIYGKFQRKNANNRGKIMLNKYKFNTGIEMEACLCHEVIHWLTTGADMITYSIPGGNVELVLPDNVWLKAGYKKITKHGKTKTEILTYADVAQNGFLKEGLTELLKQQIYPSTEVKATYNIQTSFVKLLNQVCGCDLKTCFKDFLQGDLVTYKTALGNFDHAKLQKSLDVFMMEYKMINRSEEKIHTSSNLQDAYAIVLTYAFKNYRKQNGSIENIFKYIDDLSKNIAAFNADTVYNSSIIYVTDIFRRTVSSDENVVKQFQQKYLETLLKKEESMWYKAERNHFKGFKVAGFSENIYLIPSNGLTKLNTLIYTDDVRLSRMLCPDKVGGKYVYNPDDINVAPLVIIKDAENSIRYIQGDLEKRIVIEDDKCVVYDKNNQVLDMGYIAYSGNAELKENQYANSVNNFDRFVEDVKGMDVKPKIEVKNPTEAPTI